MEVFSAVSLGAYAVSLVTVVAIAASVVRTASRSGTRLSPDRLAGLMRDELRRLGTLNAVFLMHVSIALGVGLSLLIAVLDPFFYLFPPLMTVLAVIALPLIAGLVAAFAWRVSRYVQSKKVERELLHVDGSFTRSSTAMQLVLVAMIALTTSELALAWVSGSAVVAEAVGAVRNVLVIVYYSRPSVNLVKSFDRPLPAVTLPFKLGDVLEGRVDAADVKLGAGKLSDFEGFERLSYNSCVEIGACESSCPATAAGRRLSPRVLVRELALLEKGGGDADPMGAVSEDEVWSCTSCGACVHACPVAVKHVDIVYDLRRTLVGGGKLDKEKSTLLQNLAQSQNPYGLDPRSRGDWARESGVKTLAESPNAEYVYWVGCVSSFDQRAQGVARSLAKLLQSAGLSFAILGSEEACTGDPARRLGEEGRYQELAYHNIEKLNGYKVRKVITSCPHCFNSIKNEYPLFGGNYEVVHHTQVLSDLIRSGKLIVAPELVKEASVTLHDACYAARYNNIFDEPRQVLSASGAEVVEMHRNRDRTFCCGAGGSNYWYKVPQQRSIAAIRTEEAAQTGAGTLATECPFCLSMFEDSAKASGNGMRVRDVAELLAEERLTSESARGLREA